MRRVFASRMPGRQYNVGGAGTGVFVWGPLRDGERIKRILFNCHTSATPGDRLTLGFWALTTNQNVTAANAQTNGRPLVDQGTFQVGTDPLNGSAQYEFPVNFVGDGQERFLAMTFGGSTGACVGSAWADCDSLDEVIDGPPADDNPV